MSYDKARLTEKELQALYKKDAIKVGEDGRIVFREQHYFQEYYGMVSVLNSSKVLKKGERFKVQLNFPGELPLLEPFENWFQIALRDHGKATGKFINYEATYRGFLPGKFTHYEGWKHGTQAEFRLEDEPENANVNYALFIYRRPEFAGALKKVEQTLMDAFTRERTAVCDEFGNYIMISDDCTNFPMILVPIGLLTGGKDYICSVWEDMLINAH